MEEKELWMNKLKEKLADYSEPVPASGWEQLEKELMPPVEKKIYPYRKWMMAAAAVILLAVVSSVSLYFLGTPAADEIRHIKTPALASTPDALPGVQQPDVQGTSVEPVLRPVAREDRLAKIDKNLTEQTTNAGQSAIENNNEPVTGNENNPVIEEDQMLKGETEQTKNEAKQVDSDRIPNGRTTGRVALPAETSCIFRQKKEHLKKEHGPWDSRSEIRAEHPQKSVPALMLICLV